MANDKVIMIDDTQTNARDWVGWQVRGFSPGEPEITITDGVEIKDVFTRQDFENALKKVSRKIKR